MENEIVASPVFESQHIELWMVNGIVRGRFKKSSINLESAKGLVKDRLAFTKGKPYPTLISDQGVAEMDREARSYFASDNGVEGISAAAILVSSAFGAYMANFFLRISFTSRKMPARVFSKEEDALKWLSQYRSEE